MSSELISRALASATDTRVVALGPGALAETPRVFRECFGEATAQLVGDERTMAVAGNAVLAALQQAGVPTVPPHVHPGAPEVYASYDNVTALREVLATSEVVAIAVGGGTMNDLVKRASAELGRGYLTVCTAPSMDGYTAFGASIAVDGFKQTLSCPAPRGCVADLDVLNQAPLVMTSSGYGDLIGKLTAGADWMIADAVGSEPIDPHSWQLVQGPLRASLARPEALAAGDPDAVAALTEGLLMSGLAMQGHQSSRPASGSEHQFSHLWEMEGHGVDRTPRRLSHGHKVAVGTVAIAALYEALLRRGLADLDIDAALDGWLDAEATRAHVVALNQGSPLTAEMIEQTLAKWVDRDQLRARLVTLKKAWPGLAKRIGAQLLPAAEIQRMLRAVGAPAHPDEIGLGWQRFRETYLRAQQIRKRYTVLDLAYETGLLEPIVDELFSPDGFWGRQARSAS